MILKLYSKATYNSVFTDIKIIEIGCELTSGKASEKLEACEYFCPLSVHLYILPYTSRSTKFSGKKND